MKNYQTVEYAEGKFCGDSTQLQKHPAYALISVTHPQGGNVEMFGSDITHDNRVCLTVSKAYMETSHGVTRYSEAYGEPGGRIIAEIELTPHQWASMIASHSGAGTPCTLKYVTTKGEGQIPNIKGQNTYRERSENSLRKSIEKLISSHETGVEALETLVAKGKASKKELTEALEKVKAFSARLPEYTEFSVDMFHEEVEIIATKAQAEAEAALQNLIVRRGLNSLHVDQETKTLVITNNGDFKEIGTGE